VEIVRDCHSFHDCQNVILVTMKFTTMKTPSVAVALATEGRDNVLWNRMKMVENGWDYIVLAKN